MRSVYGAYVLLGLVLWPLPLLNVLQVESAAVVAFVSFFVAGWSAVWHFQDDATTLGVELGRQELALGIPLGMLTVSQLWAPNCTFGEGLLFYALFPCVTVVLAVAVAYMVTGVGTTRPFLLLGGLGLSIAVLGPVYDLGFHPQFYTYNHVFGGVLGPIYDEQLALRPGLFVFRGLTLLWALAGILAGRSWRGRGGAVLLIPCLAVIAGVYWWAVPLGLNTSGERIQEELGGHVRTDHFDIYYDRGTLDTGDVRNLADDHETRYAQIREDLALSPEEEPDRIQSYVYPNPDVKAALTGARTTSVTPVWLDTPQVHLLIDRVESSLGHELAHVFSRQYGLPVLRASWAPGLVEGWAVALEPPDPYPSSHDLVSVASTADSVGALAAKADAISSRLSPWGFWTGRGAVSYATMGSFVGYLLDTYGAEKLKRVYARGNFRAVYGAPLTSLAAQWAEHVGQMSVVSRSAHELVTRQFTRPSLFERDCPHHLPVYERHFQEARRAHRRGDSASVRHHLRSALEVEPQYVPAHVVLAHRRLAQGRVGAVRRQLDTLRTARRTSTILRLQGDVHVLQGESDEARASYARALRRTPRYAHEARVRLMLRHQLTRRPDVVRILTGGASPQSQAEMLAGQGGDTTAVQPLRARLLHEGHSYRRADSLWRTVSTPFHRDAPRTWHQVWAIQKRVWWTQSAYRAGNYEVAEREANEAAEQALTYGADEWAKMIEAWADRATRAEDASEDSPEPHAEAVVHATGAS